jgi:hypothetical protein
MMPWFVRFTDATSNFGWSGAFWAATALIAGGHGNIRNCSCEQFANGNPFIFSTGFYETAQVEQFLADLIRAITYLPNRSA